MLRKALPLLSILLAAPAVAQTAVPSFDLEHLTLNPGGRDSLLLDTGDTLRVGELRASFAAHYQHDSLVYYREGERVGAVVGSRLTTHLAAAYGLFDWLELGLQVPIILAQGGDDLATEGIGSVSTTSFGAPLLQGRMTLLRESSGEPIDLGVMLGMTLPLGSEGALARDPGAGLAFVPKVGLGRVILPWMRLGAEVGARVRQSSSLSAFAQDPADDVGSQMSLGVMASTLGKGLRGELSVRGLVPFGDAGSSVELLAGARYPFADTGFEAFALAGPGFGATPGTPLFRLLAGVAWTPWSRPRCEEGQLYEIADCPELDRDADGVRNGADSCPTESGLAALDGCPDRDDDGDGVLNLADRCPKQKGAQKYEGCPAPDSDADGLDDEKDACPTEAGPAERKGCPVKDGDGDGIEDGADACPTEAGPAEHKGCPVKDGDADGIEDELDACPTEAGIPELLGCPDKDGDGDGVVDRLDNCPAEKGAADNGGCPKEKKQLVSIEAEKIAIKEKVFFALGKSEVAAKSFEMLGQIAALLEAHPEIERVRIEGHTDDSGPRELNMTLSQARAEAVKAFLVEKGVDEKRLEAIGLGPDVPVASNADKAGREQNRRVEFAIGRKAQ